MHEQNLYRIIRIETDGSRQILFTLDCAEQAEFLFQEASQHGIQGQKILLESLVCKVEVIQEHFFSVTS